MEKEKNNLLTVLLTIIIMLILLIITVVIMKKNGYVTFGKNDSKCRDNQIVNNTNNIGLNNNDLVGVYSYEDGNNQDKKFYTVKLYSNGLFDYTFGSNAFTEYTGNYYIEDNNLILNYLFVESTSYGIRLLSKLQTKKFIINNDGTLTDEKPILYEGDTNTYSSITLLKDKSISLNSDEIINKLNRTDIIK